MIHVACIGAGYFAPFHVDGWQRIPEVSLKAIVDLNPERAEALARNYKVEHTFSTIDALFNSIRVDVIDIITPPDTHLTLIKKCRHADMHIICQKPLALSYEEAVDIVNLASQGTKRFMVHENFRFQPWYRKIKKLLDQGLVGDRIFSAYFRMRMGDGWGKDAYLDRQPYFREMPRLLIYETGIHFIDVIRYLFGEIDSVFADLRTLNSHIKGEDSSLIWFKAQNGTRIIFDGNRYNESTAENPRYTFGELTIDGSLGTLRLYLDGRMTFQPLGSREHELDYEHRDVQFAGDCVYFTQRHFVDCLLNGLPFEHEGNSYLTNLKIQESIYRSHDTQSVISMNA